MGKKVKYVLKIFVLIILIVGAGSVVYAKMRQKSAGPESTDVKGTDESVPGNQSADQEQVQRAEKIKVACVGDSITYGAGVISTRSRNSYPAKLAKLLGDDYTVFNFGVSGTTLINETNKPYRNESAFKESLEADPDIVLIMLGTNDSKASNWNAGAYERQLQDVVNIYKELPGSPQVYLMTCCAAYGEDGQDVVAFHVNKTVISVEIAAIIQRTARSCEVPVIDIYNATKDSPAYFVDGVHPNADGNEEIAQTVYRALIR